MKKIIISRTDSIGDVVLTLPVAGVIKKHFPECRILFLGRKYTQPLIEACGFVDEFVDGDSLDFSSQSAVRSQKYITDDVDAILHVFPVKKICHWAKKAGIPLRIATSHRWFTWLYCNRLIYFSRKNSPLHEAQLNLKLLEPLGIKSDIPIEDISLYYGLTKLPPLSPLPPGGNTPPPVPPPGGRGAKYAIILHPKSKGSAREWGLDNFSRLIDLITDARYRIYITGTKEEGAMMKDFLERNREKVTDMTGKFTLSELISFIGQCDALVAASTGPLHIAAALGKRAVGIYPPIRPMHPGRWAPLGKNASYLVIDKKCSKCRKSGDCECIRSITPEEVAGKLIRNLQV